MPATGVMLGGANRDNSRSRWRPAARDRESLADLVTGYRRGSLAIVGPICFPLVKPGLAEPFLHLLHRLICKERSDANSKRQSNQQNLFHPRTIESKSWLRAYQAGHRSAVSFQVSGFGFQLFLSCFTKRKTPRAFRHEAFQLLGEDLSSRYFFFRSWWHRWGGDVLGACIFEDLFGAILLIIVACMHRDKEIARL